VNSEVKTAVRLSPTARTGALAGRRIVVTRPAGQATHFAEMIRAAGGEPVWFPTIDIAPLRDTAPLDAALAGLARFDLAVFVSANAVLHAFARLDALQRDWPTALRVAATGPGTAAELTARGCTAIHPPARFDSEGLLAEIDRLGLQPQHVLIVRGTGGREWLLDNFAARGVKVETVASYARVCGAADAAPLIGMARTNQIDAFTVTSSEGGEHLLAMLGADALTIIGQTPLFVPHPRIAARMRADDCVNVIETAGGDAGLIAGMTTYFAQAA
jgi:uroporphyrinogen-III synthase